MASSGSNRSYSGRWTPSRFRADSWRRLTRTESGIPGFLNSLKHRPPNSGVSRSVRTRQSRVVRTGSFWAWTDLLRIPGIRAGQRQQALEQRCLSCQRLSRTRKPGFSKWPKTLSTAMVRGRPYRSVPDHQGDHDSQRSKVSEDARERYVPNPETVVVVVPISLIFHPGRHQHIEGYMHEGWVDEVPQRNL